MYCGKCFDCITRLFFFFNDTATTEIYTLSLHDALPICPGDPAHPHRPAGRPAAPGAPAGGHDRAAAAPLAAGRGRSEEHTSELQSRQYLVCRLLLEKKKKNQSSWRHIVSTEHH